MNHSKRRVLVFGAYPAACLMVNTSSATDIVSVTPSSGATVGTEARLNTPAEVVIDRVKPCGRLFVRPGGTTDSVRAFHRNGEPAGVFLGGDVEGVSVTLGFDADGNLLISQWNRNHVIVMSPSGEVIRLIDSGGLGWPTGTAVTPSGDIAVCSYHSDSIKFYRTDGTYLSNLGHSGTEDPLGLAYDGAGNLFVGSRNNGNQRVAMFNSDLVFVKYIGQGELGANPDDLAFDESGYLYVATSPGVRKYDTDSGNLLETWSHQDLEPKSMAFDEDENLFVTDTDSTEVFVFGPSGQVLKRMQLDPRPNPPAGFFYSGIAFDVLPDSDCNDNGEPDACEIAAGDELDCIFNGVPDSCELEGNDCNADLIPDDCEPDCDENGTPDECQITDGTSDDCNGNGVPDECELSGSGQLPPSEAIECPLNGSFYLLTPILSWPDAEGLAVSMGGHLATVRSEAENNWIVDTFASITEETHVYSGFNDIASEGEWVWASGAAVTYTNWYPGEPNNMGNEDWGEIELHPRGGHSPGFWNDGRVFKAGVVEIISGNDCNQNDILDECDIADQTSVDCNSNEIPDECEPDEDCNTNGVQDICDLFDETSLDCNGSGTPDECELIDNDCNANEVPDDCEDCNGSGLADECDIDAGASEDCNSNEIPDECEPDCNENGTADECDIAGGESYDFDLNGVPDECQPDCNDNGFPDFLDIAFGTALDCNGNAVPDACDLTVGTSTDCNGNTIPDSCDIEETFSDDCDRDGTPDECEPDGDLDGIPDDCDRLCDYDHDADVDLEDYEFFELCLDLSGPSEPPPFLVCLDVFDAGSPGTIDLRDFAAFQQVFTD